MTHVVALLRGGPAASNYSGSGFRVGVPDYQVVIWDAVQVAVNAGSVTFISDTLTSAWARTSR